MRTAFIAIFTVFLSSSYASGKIPMAFLGIKDTEEPLVKNELERLIYRELRSQSRYKLVPSSQIQLFLEKGTLHGPEIGTKPSVKTAKDLKTRILSFGVLKRMELEVSRKWFNPSKGNATFKHSMWLKVIDGKNGEMKFSGLIEASEEVENIYLGPEPTVGTIDPIIRDASLVKLMEKLAVETKNRIVASLASVKVEKEEAKKLYDPDMFEKKEVAPPDTAKPAIQRKIPIKPKIYTFPKKKKKEDNRSLDENTLEKLENDQELLDDVNLLEGM